MPFHRVLIAREATARERATLIIEAADESAASIEARDIMTELPGNLSWEPAGAIGSGPPQIVETSPIAVVSRDETTEAQVRRNQAIEARRRRAANASSDGDA